MEEPTRKQPTEDGDKSETYKQHTRELWDELKRSSMNHGVPEDQEGESDEELTVKEIS